MAGRRCLRTVAPRAGRAADVHSPRRPALCQWRYPYRPCDAEDAEGPGCPHPVVARQGRAVRAGVGLPRPADRMEGRGGISEGQAQQGRGAGDGISRRMPRLCAKMDRRAVGAVSAARHRRGVGPTVLDDGFCVGSGDCFRIAQVRRVGPALSRGKAGDVVTGRKDRAGRGRGRVSRRGIDADRCGVRDCRVTDCGTGRRICGDLDDDAMDDPGQPGDRLWAGDCVCRRAP